jgi:hypothetical protein
MSDFWQHLLLLGLAGWLLTRLCAPQAVWRQRRTLGRALAARLRAAHPAATVRDMPTRLVVTLDARQGVVRLPPLWRRTAELPAHTSPLLAGAAHAVASALSAAAPPAAARLLPLLVHPAAPQPPLVTRPLAPGLEQALALEEAQAFRWVTPALLSALGLTPDAAFTLADRALLRSCARLRILPLLTAPDGADRLVRFDSGDGLDAARAALPDLYARFSPRFAAAELYLALPARDHLLLFSPDTTPVSLLRWQLRVAFATRAFPLTPRIWRLTPDGLLPAPDVSLRPPADA